jgi:hypothetical protein
VPKEASLTRRSALQLLVVAAASTVAGCRSGKQQAAPAAPATGATPATQPPASVAAPSTRTTATPASPPAAPATTTDAPARATLADPTAQAAATSERALVAAYDDAMGAHPDLATALGAFRADHAAHLKALNPDLVLSPAPAPMPTSTASPTVPASPPASPPAATVLATLNDLETRAAAARLGDMATATGSLAALLASIGGCEAAHAATLATALASP